MTDLMQWRHRNSVVMPSANDPKGLYEALSISVTASGDEIRKAYKKLALRWHPDKNQGNEEATEMFQKISKAYTVLSDADKKAMYDRNGSVGDDEEEDMGDEEDFLNMFMSMFGGDMQGMDFMSAMMGDIMFDEMGMGHTFMGFHSGEHDDDHDDDTDEWDDEDEDYEHADEEESLHRMAAMLQASGLDMDDVLGAGDLDSLEEMLGMLSGMGVSGGPKKAAKSTSQASSSAARGASSSAQNSRRGVVVEEIDSSSSSESESEDEQVVGGAKANVGTPDLNAFAAAAQSGDPETIAALLELVNDVERAQQMGLELPEEILRALEGIQGGLDQKLNRQQPTVIPEGLRPKGSGAKVVEEVSDDEDDDDESDFDADGSDWEDEDEWDDEDGEEDEEGNPLAGFDVDDEVLIEMMSQDPTLAAMLGGRGGVAALAEMLTGKGAPKKKSAAPKPAPAAVAKRSPVVEGVMDHEMRRQEKLLKNLMRSEKELMSLESMLGSLGVGGGEDEDDAELVEKFTRMLMMQGGMADAAFDDEDQ